MRLGLQQNAIAEKLGVSESSVSSWLRGEVPKLKNLSALAEILNCRVEWLLGENEPGKNPGGLYSGAASQAPVLSWASAGIVIECREGDTPKIATDCKDPNCYALTVDGDSMMPVYLPGDVLVVEPGSAVQFGDIAIVKTLDDLVLFKRVEYADDQRNFRLVSFNPNYPPIEIKRPSIRFIHPIFSVTRFRNKIRLCH